MPGSTAILGEEEQNKDVTGDERNVTEAAKDFYFDSTLKSIL